MRYDDYPLHDSIRGHFGRALYFAMRDNPDIWIITADLGFPMFDSIQADFRDRYANTGAAEQCAVGMGIGLALSGKIPFVYSITSFLLFRAFEWHRNYLEHEKIPVFLIGSGLDDDYKHDGISHQTFDAKEVLNLFPSIVRYYPTKENMEEQVRTMIKQKQPAFMCLRR